VNTTTTKWIDVDKLAPLGDAEVWRLARAEYLRMLSLLALARPRGLSAPDRLPGLDGSRHARVTWSERPRVSATRSSLCTSTAQVRD